MSDTTKRIPNRERLERLGSFLRDRRDALGLAQGQVRGMRQATISKIERGGDVNLDTVISYAAALGLELALVPIGQSPAQVNPNQIKGAAMGPPAWKLKAARRPLDLLDEFADLKDEAP